MPFPWQTPGRVDHHPPEHEPPPDPAGEDGDSGGEDEWDDGDGDGGTEEQPSAPDPTTEESTGTARHPPPTPMPLLAALAVAAAGLVLLLVRRRRRRRGRQAAPPPPPPGRRPARGHARPAAAAAAWIKPLAPEAAALLPAAGAPGTTPLIGLRVVASPTLATSPALGRLAAAGAAVLGTIPDGPGGPGPLAGEDAAAPAAGCLNPAVPRGGARLAGPGARLAAAVSAGAADAGLAASPPSSLPWALAAAAGLAALRTPTATLAARSVEGVAAAATSAGLARPRSASASASASAIGSIIVAEDLFDGCGGEPAAVAAMAAAGRAAAAAWATPAGVNPAAAVPFLKASIPAAASFLTPEEWEAGAVLRGLRRAAAVLSGEEEVEGQGSRASAAAAAEAADQARAALAHICSDGDLLLVPSLPGPHPPGREGEAPAAERAAWSAGLRGLASLGGLSGLVALTIPVPVSAGAFPAGLALIGGAGSEGAVLAAGVCVAAALAIEWERALAAAGAAIGAAAAGLLQDGGGGPPPHSPATSAASAATTAPARPAPPPFQSTSPGQAPVRAEATPDARTAATLRASGNAAYRAGDWAGAAAVYAAAAAADPTCSLARSNRAAALLNLMRFEEAEDDASASLRLAPSAKAHLRRAAARRGLGDAAGARSDLLTVLSLEPGNVQARSDLKALEQAGEW